MAAKVCPKRANHAFSEKFEIRKSNFGYRYASKSIKRFIDAEFDLVFNRLGPRASQKFQNTFICGGPPSEPPPKKKNVFFDFNKKTC